MRIKIQISIVLLLVLTAMVFMIWQGRNMEQSDIIEEIKIPVTASHPKPRTLEKRIHFRGFVESNHSVDVYPRTMGLLQSLNVEEGELVSAGQLIAVVENESAQLNLNQAEAAYNLALEDWNRYRPMYEKNLISEQQYQNAETNYKARLAQYELAKVQTEYSRVKSPINGVVQRINVEEGMLISSQVNLMSIAARGSNIIKVDVPEKYYEYFTGNTSLPIEVIRPANPSTVFPGAIQYVSPFISPGTMKFQITLEIEDRGILVPGMYVETAFVLERLDNQLSLPYSAMTRKGELWMVDENNMVHSFVPEIMFQGDNYFALDEKWTTARIISEGQHFLSEGQEVRIVNGDELP